jgi:hypothetical protein
MVFPPVYTGRSSQENNFIVKISDQLSIAMDAVYLMGMIDS